MKVKVAVINAFVDGNDGGNPAGVVLDAGGLSQQQRLTIATKIGLSETAFVSDSDVADFKLDFYTPTRQIAHCGHATIATFSYLSQLGSIEHPVTSKETIDGVRRIEMRDEYAFMEQLAPNYQRPGYQQNELYAALGTSAENVSNDPLIVGTGNSFLIIGVNDLEALKSLEPNLELIDSISKAHDLIGFYVYTLETNRQGRDASTRMFAPTYGIAEESATGMAAGPLACYLHDHMRIRKDTFKIEQGYAMLPSSPSCIEVELIKQEQKIQSLRAGGIGVLTKVEYIDV